MATYDETKVLRALVAWLKTVSFSPALPIAWPNVDFDPPSEATWLRATWLPAETAPATLGEGGENRHSGLFQVDVFVPLEIGHIVPTEYAGAIARAFKRGSDFTSDGVTVRVVTPPSVLTGYKQPPWYGVPVRIRYFADIPNPS
ncbi:DUF4128 domain-containing protein [Microbaculum marinum]|uniref:DUF4128 domain-containing protein n=1 Tax=Microbaculum marinum TaxID=1764581 RepID=A0AAW9RQK6_9HYPH